MKGTCDSDPATICQGGNDQTGGGSHVLVTVLEAGTDLLHTAVIDLLIPVVSELLLPSKVVDGGNIILDKIFHDITGMHVSGDEGHNDLSLKGSKFTSDELSKLA